MAEPKQDENENSSDEEDKNSHNAQSTDTEVVEEEHPREDNGYSLERESPCHQNQAERREEEGENVNEQAQETTDQECGPRGTICGLASQQPYHSSAVSQNQPERYAKLAAAGQIRSENLVANSERARAQPQTGQEVSNGEDNSQLSQGQPHEEEDEQQNLQLVNRNNTLEDGNLFPLPGWTEKGQRVQQCTEENPPGGMDTESGTPQEHDCLCETCQST